jgi:hypothetical protein
MLLDPNPDMVYFGRSQCSRQHAFAAFVHAGVPDADARRKADALPRVIGPASVVFASPGDNASDDVDSTDKAIPAEAIAKDTGMDPKTFGDRLAFAIGIAQGLASDPREVASKALESLNINPKTADPKYMAEALRLATPPPTTTPDGGETNSAAEQTAGYPPLGSGRRKDVVIGSIGAGPPPSERCRPYHLRDCRGGTARTLTGQTRDFKTIRR